MAEQLLQPSYEIHVGIEGEVALTVAIFEETAETAACVVGVRDTQERSLYKGVLQIAIEALEAAHFTKVKAKDGGDDGTGSAGTGWTDTPPF